MRYAVVPLIVLAGLFASPACFAVGEGVGGTVATIRITSGTGQSSNDGLMSLGFSSSLHSSTGFAASVASMNYNRSTNDGYMGTGGGNLKTASKGVQSNSVSGKVYSVPVVHGVGITNASPGGRGL